MHKTKSGFTLVELLIVIVIIAILAAITVVAYNGIQNKAYNSTVQSDAGAIVKKLELFKVDNGHYPVNTVELSTITGMHLSNSAYDTTQNNVYYYYDNTNDMYAFGLRSKALKGYMIVNGTIKEVGNGGSANVSGAATGQAIADAGGAYTYGSTWFLTTTGWNATVAWAK